VLVGCGCVGECASCSTRWPSLETRGYPHSCLGLGGLWSVSHQRLAPEGLLEHAVPSSSSAFTTVSCPRFAASCKGRWSSLPAWLTSNTRGAGWRMSSSVREEVELICFQARPRSVPVTAAPGSHPGRVL
jgi:hypothetical protein